MVTTSEPNLPEADPGIDDAAGSGGRKGLRWAHRRWVAGAAFSAAGILLFFAYLAQARTMGIHLDASSASGPQILQAWDILHGNVLLRGWSLADVSFYTIDLPIYVLVELARGLNGDVVHVAAALTYTLVVLLAGVLAKGRATGTEGLVRLLVAVGIMLAPPLGSGTSVVLSGPDHTGTQIGLLLIWLVLDRARARWWVPVAVAALLTWAQIGDLIVLYEGVLPLVAVCAVRMYRRGGSLNGQWYELSLVAGALVSVAAARLALILIRHAGGFYVKTPTARFSTPAHFAAQFSPKVNRVLDLFGVSFSGPLYGHTALVGLLHLVGVALVSWAVAVGVRRFIGGDDLLVQVLTVAFALLLAAYMLGTKSDPNEMVGLLPMGAVLAGRLLAGRLSHGRLLAMAMALVLACYCGVLLDHATKPPASNQSLPSASWFEAHHLRLGLGDVAEASIVTVDSGNAVQVRPVRIFRDRLVTTPWENDASWYDPHRNDANFVIFSIPRTCGNACRPLADVRKTFGPPVATYRVGHFVVLVWRQNLLDRLPTLSWCGNVWPWTATTEPSPGHCH